MDHHTVNNVTSRYSISDIDQPLATAIVDSRNPAAPLLLNNRNIYHLYIASELGQD